MTAAFRQSLVIFFLSLFILPLNLSFAAEETEETVPAPVVRRTEPITEPFDHWLWDQFLKKFVNEKGQMDYKRALKDRSLFDEYLEKLAAIDDYELRNLWPREEKLALWLNAYHAAIVLMVFNHYPIESLLDVPGVWDIDVLQVGVLYFSINRIQRDQLLGRFRDEKIHAVLACSAKGCPGFMRRAFVGPDVEGQLYLAAKRFVNNEQFVEITPGKKKIKLSRIFKWYAKDFKLDFGHASPNDLGHEIPSHEYAVLSFVANYLDDLEKIEFLEEGAYKIKYPKFDWALNEAIA